MKRLLDVSLSAAALMVLSPALLLLSGLILADSGWPVLFVQTRIGRHFLPFRLLKFRSMRNGSSSGPAITIGKDSRVTRFGGFLRRSKLDELPQLWNVLRGEMSLVGPRPEVPAFVSFPDPQWKAILAVRPGLLDPASLAFRNESEMLGSMANPSESYGAVILPHKLALSRQYLESRSIGSDLRILIKGLALVFRGARGFPS